MTVRDLYQEAILNDFYSLQLLIRFLVYEKKSVKLEDHHGRLEFFLQEKFQSKMNEYLIKYEVEND
ncbi:hypothetical protein [Cytobacillus horneckiae]|uniref:Uncharacterized protein n=1 Tax=Cytobacillus horneckiae TaxID=549687 RepID=A0A2N0ZB78_9BACI|nr:hypothetical protein [Cytobacillus horneckiae]MEC1155516.1 hypothetical protein [Cytobacillus horneckiae]MED2936835.1 hypothetical protein [Cytobacillus horneckiae]PKG26744.1 hypothetical protein CWS20_22450 [Cytobacillus horneckiae]